MKKYILENLKEYLAPAYKKLLFKKWMIEYKLNAHSTIKEINIEFASFCNLRCKWCSLDHSKKKVNLSKDVLERLLKDLVYDKRFKLVKKLNLWNAGEILLNRELVPLLKLLKKYKTMGIRKNKFFPSVNLLTNGILLSESLSEKIISENVIDRIMFSVDGGTKEEYEEIRRGAKWDILVRNINSFLRVSKGHNITTEVICMVDSKRPLSQDWMDKDFRKVLDKIDVISLRHPHNWDGSVELGIKKKKKKKNGCYFLMCQLVLLPNGDVTVCCADLNSRGVIGNILENSLFEIYDSEKRRKMIKLNFSGNRNKIILCHNCDVE